MTASEMLYKAATLGDLATIETLLSAGVNPDLPDRYGQTPLCFAMQAGKTQVVELLLAWHANPNAPLNGQSRETPLQFAIRSANLPMVSILIVGGADINAKGPGGRTALHFAVADVHLDMIRLLIEKGADVNSRDGEGTSPLDEAVWDGSLDAVAVLLAHGARLNESHTKTGATPINEASYRGNASVVEYLLQFHPDLGIPDKRGYSPLDNAIRMAKEDSALLLLPGWCGSAITDGWPTGAAANGRRGAGSCWEPNRWKRYLPRFPVQVEALSRLRGRGRSGRDHRTPRVSSLPEQHMDKFTTT